jgi:D-alanine-D-alanine ligase-like ATP-grasp enzyme
MKPCFVTPLISKAAKAIGAKLLLEPVYQYAGQITFKNGKRHYFKNASLDINPAGASEIANDKAYSAFFMQQMGYNTIEGKAFFSARWQRLIRSDQGMQAALAYAKNLGFPVVIKPNDLSQGIAVSKVYNASELRSAIKNMPPRSRSYLVQRVAEGDDYRLVVFDGKLICAYQRRPLCITGDGKSPIAKLLAQKQKAFDQLGYETTIDISDPRIRVKLKRQRLTLSSVPVRGQQVKLLDNANLSSGGDAIDIIASIHASYGKLATSIASDMGLRLCGVDIMTSNDITRGVKQYHVIEVNASPGLDHFSLLGKKQRSITEALYLDILRALEKLP